MITANNSIGYIEDIGYIQYIEIIIKKLKLGKIDDEDTIVPKQQMFLWACFINKKYPLYKKELIKYTVWEKAFTEVIILDIIE